MIERTVYQCQHCKTFKRTPKIYFSKDKMYYHENSCFYNLKNKTCLTCKYNEYGRYDAKLDMRLNDCEIEVQKPERIYIKSDTIITNCEKWEYIYDIEEEEISEDN